MTDGQAIDFLKSVQPLPDVSELSEELIGRFDEVRRHFIRWPNELAIPLLLNSFGNGDGFGVYQLVEDAIAAAPSTIVIPHLVNALASQYSSVRYWACQISANYDDKRLVSPLLGLLQDKSDDIRMAALISIEKYLDEMIIAELRKLRDRESDREILQLIDDVLSNLPDRSMFTGTLSNNGR